LTRTILTDAELAEIREELHILLPENGRILKQTKMQTPGKGYKETFTPVAPDIDCAIKPVSGANSMSGNKIDDRTTDFVQVPALTEVTADDRIEIDGWGTFEVTFVHKRSEELLRTIEVREVG
jgi:hypothetical protein